MNSTVKAILFSVFSVLNISAVAAVTAEKPKAEKDVLMKCIYLVSTAEGATVSASLPQQSLGFKFQLQRNNSNHVAVDIFSLNENKKPIKQIGHAELVSSVTDVTKTTLTSDLLAQLSQAEDSPFQFEYSSTNEVGLLTTFSGETYTSVPIQCAVSSEKALVDEVPPKQ
jgi:hypothetical protein